MTVNWVGFGAHDIYWEVFDPYVDEQRVAGSLSDDFLDIYRDVHRGLRAYDQGNERGAAWEWKFHFDEHWGDHAVDALRALQRACRNVEVQLRSKDSPAAGRVLVTSGGLVDETKISIGIHGPDLDPERVTQLLGVKPTGGHRSGQPRKSGPPWRHGAWLFTCEGRAPRGPNEVAMDFLEALPSADAPVWTELRSNYGLHLKVAVFFNGWNRGFELDADLVNRLARLAGSLDFDIYADG